VAGPLKVAKNFRVYLPQFLNPTSEISKIAGIPGTF